MRLKREYYSYVMMLGHLCADLGGGALPAILPFLVAEKGLTYAAAAGLTFAVSSVGSLIQPVFGSLSDKYPRTWTMGLGVLMSSCGISLIGFMDNYWMMFIAAMITGIGAALFHPDGGRMANYVSGVKKGRGISLFAVGGNMGGALGPMLAVLGISLIGLKGTIFLAVPAVLMGLFLFSQNRVLTEFAHEGAASTKAAQAAGQKDDWGAFAKLTFAVVMRSIVNNGINTFVPLFWVAILLQTQETAGTTSTVLAVAGALSTLAAGRLADRFGFTKVIRAGLTFYAPFIILLILSRNLLLSTLLLLPLALCGNLAFSPTVALGQKFVPNHIGLASGVTMGLAGSIGGMITPLLGKVGDTAGLPTVMWLLVALAAVGCVVSYFVPHAPEELAAKAK